MGLNLYLTQRPGVQGWFLPAEAAMQFQQCMVQKVRPEVLVPAAEDKKKKKTPLGEAAASLLQLPGVDVDVVRALDKNSRIKSLQVRAPSVFLFTVCFVARACA